jgi:hypothetical protein
MIRHMDRCAHIDRRRYFCLLVARVMQKLWFAAVGTSFGLCVTLIGVDAARNESSPHYSLWGSPLAVGVYVTAAIGFVSLICALFNLRFPDLSRGRLREQGKEKVAIVLTSERSSLTLGEDNLRRIKEISAARRNTGAEKQRLLAPYIGRRMQITGIVIDVSKWNGSSSLVTVRPYIRNFTASMNFSDKDTFDQHLEILTAKTQVTVIGTIEQIGPNGISLVECEIVSISRFGYRAT